MSGGKVIRLIQMTLLINAHPGLTAQELAKRSGISVRTCFRDIQALCYAGVPIFCDNGYRLVEKSQLQKVSLTLEEALALIYGIKLLEKQKGFLHSGVQVKEKLLELLPVQLRHEVEDMQKQIAVSAEVTVDYSGKDALFKKINTAMRTCRCLNMDYYSFSSNKVTNRTVAPYQMVFRDGFWYLVGDCHLRGEIRLFRVDRIRSLAIREEEFLRPANFDLDSYLGSAWQMERGREYVFTIRFTGDAARYVRETQFHPSQQLRPEHGAVLFSARACGLKSVTRWILQFGGEAEVLEPEELRDSVRQQLQKALQNYPGEN